MNTRMLAVCILSIAAVLLLTGCSDRTDLEDATIPLALGLDLDENNKFHVYITSPEFSKSVKKKHHEISEPADTLRQSRIGQDAHSAGAFQGRKYQVVLLGQRLLQQENWFRMLDVLFRDSKNTVTDRVIAINGSISKLIELNPPDEPYLPLLLKGMIDTKSARSETVKTTVQELHRQIFETGITPSIAEVKLAENNDIRLNGTMLLDHKGKYATTLNAQETVLLKLLQKEARKSSSLSFTVPGIPKTGPFQTNMISLSTEGARTKIKTSYGDDKFQFQFTVHIPAVLSEKVFPYNLRKNGNQLDTIIAKQAQLQFENLIKKIQQHKIDPIGLGLYARAYHYKQFAQVEDHWGEALAKADIHVSVNVTFKAMGPVK
ncbi:Ger(x)C family spore germination protein [Paenibacillus sp. UNC451MF]|uniref:Ger(x)C family spore germination protein n=1 Tax=Paenibacillus sp. UNC451MF TaxID=1449063 RepID=UPI00048A570B|nr:Ger(x)C family spore germination protein [Paenibacillus sp. UNC451MF]